MNKPKEKKDIRCNTRITQQQSNYIKKYVEIRGGKEGDLHRAMIYEYMDKNPLSRLKPLKPVK